MANFSYAPRYRLYLKRGDGRAFSIKTLQSAQALLVTGAGVNQATFVLGDTAGTLRKTVQPHPMNRIELWTANRWSQWGRCWSGYVDEVHRAFDPEQGDNVTLACTGPVKLFEITRQAPGDVASLALAYAQNITGSAVLGFAARACGYPSSMLRIHPQADSGSGYQQIGSGVFTNPDQQPWSSVVSAIQANCGIEWFFDEGGYCYWRQIGFLDPWFSSAGGGPPRPRTLGPRRIAREDILHADFSESDAGVVTDVEVRYYGGGGFVQTAVHWPRPQGSGGSAESAAHKQMVRQLRTRRLVVYASWLLTSAAAQYLADVLGAQYSAGVAQASVTIPADPLITVGSLVDVPALGVGGTTRYYVSSVTYQLTWGGSWVMTLGLAYGRSPAEQFPYTGAVAWPQLTDAVSAGGAVAGPLASLDAGNPSWDMTPYTIAVQASLASDQAATAAYPAGSVIALYTRAQSKGALIGPSVTGEYTVVAPTNAAQSATTIALSATHVTTGYVTIHQIAPASSPAVPDAPVGDVQSYVPSSAGTATGPDGDPLAAPARPPGTATTALAALTQAEVLNGRPYIGGRAGDDAWDCSGVVSWAFAQVGIDCGFLPGAGGSGINGDRGPGFIYDFFAALGATPIDVDQAQVGDLLFIYTGQASQGGYHHVCFCSGTGQNFGGDNPDWGVRYAANEGFTDTGSADGTTLNRALSLATVQWGRAART